MSYHHKQLEPHWQNHWKNKNVFKTTENKTKPKFYALDMFPYPSSSGLHVGHPMGYTATDIVSRYYRMKGYNVLHPMGWDAFGLPAENHALANKTHPSLQMAENIVQFKKQLMMMGVNYDWSHEINTTDPTFYKWTQWCFLQMYKKGLAYESHEPINWCPTCKTGLANEDLDPDGTCERCGSVVEKKPLRQWVLRITDYADRLLDDLDTLEQWPQWVKEAQRNWIGKSEGSLIPFILKTKATEEPMNIFTTRADTLFGCTYFVLAPEHSFIHSHEKDIENIDEVKAYIEALKGKSEIERTAHGKEKTGVQLKGITAINPANGEEVPVWIADYVLAGYGTGAVMAVPAHDERDWAFAKKYGLQIKLVVTPDQIGAFAIHDAYSSQEQKDTELDESFTQKKEKILNKELCYPLLGTLIASGEFNNLSSQEAKQKITEFVGGTVTSNYKLKDWVFSRQRYWGEPIPLVHVGQTVYPITDTQLPVVLPNVESYEPTGTGESPLAGIDEWVNVSGYITDAGDFVVADTAPAGKELIQGKRETNTMPQWAGSSWYYLRYMDPQNPDTLVDPAKEKAWSPIDVYVGGDHATRHLIYARFWHKFLFDIGVVSHQEPFPRLEFLGHILASDGQKISKRKNNGEKPDDMIQRFGADSLRTYEMFIGPFEKAVPWSNDGLVGVRRFIEKVWRCADKVSDGGQEVIYLDKTIKKVGEDIQAFKFNTAVSQMMICVNDMDKQTSILTRDFEQFLKILAPFAPHVCDEIWRDMLHKETSIHLQDWPVYDEAKTHDDTVTLGIQVNGKVRADITVAVDAISSDVEHQVLALSEIQRWIDGKPVKKFIYVPGRIISIVTE